MKQSAAFFLLFLFAVVAWSASHHGADMGFWMDGDEIEGPLEALLGIVFAGGGLLLGGAIALLVGAILAVVFAGVGIVVIGALAVAAVAVALTVAPFLLPFVLPVLLVGYLMGRSRRHQVVRA